MEIVNDKKVLDKQDFDKLSEMTGSINRVFALLGKNQMEIEKLKVERQEIVKKHDEIGNEINQFVDEIRKKYDLQTIDISMIDGSFTGK